MQRRPSGDATLLGYRKTFGSVKRNLGEMRKQMDAIQADPALSAKEKRKQIDDILRERNRLVSDVYGQYEESRAAQP